LAGGEERCGSNKQEVRSTIITAVKIYKRLHPEVGTLKTEFTEIWGESVVVVIGNSKGWGRETSFSTHILILKKGPEHEWLEIQEKNP